ncbi:hypothetical protein [Capybara microvirus Cap1_SP_259]|nr:hypothetical protein [Capybara microvirus Cap1_SP_259]
MNISSFLSTRKAFREFKDFGVFLDVDKKNRCRLMLRHIPSGRVIELRKFVNVQSYQRFLVQGVFLRLIADSASVNKANHSYINVCNTLEDLIIKESQ